VADGTSVLDAAEETVISTTSDDITTQELVRRIVKSATVAAAGQRLETAQMDA
jgi:hypothetical protein